MLDERADPVIGARILVQPFFWPREVWLPAPTSFSPNTVSGRGYDAAESDGRRLWDAVTERLQAYAAARSGRLPAGRPSPTDTSGAAPCRASAPCPSSTPSHIKAYAAGGDHQPDNGLLLRTDIHRLFDLGYVTVSEDFRFEVGTRLRADFQNGKHYYDLHGTSLRPPHRAFPAPSREALGWHRENRFLG